MGTWPRGCRCKGAQTGQKAERVDGGSREITCGRCCWPGSPRDSREKRTEEEIRAGPGITVVWGLASKDVDWTFQFWALILSPIPTFTSGFASTPALTSLTLAVTTLTFCKCGNCSKHIFPILQARRQKARKFYKGSKWQSWDLNPGIQHL